MAEVASAYVSLLPSLRGFGSRLSREAGPQLDRAGRDGGKRLGDGMSKSFAGATKRLFAPIAAGLATLGAASFFKDAIQGASDLNEAGTKVEAIFGKSGKALVDSFAGKGAKALGQTQLDVLNAASTFGTFGKAAGLSGKDLAGFSTGLAGLSTDFSSFFNTSPEAAVEAIGAALRGESEPIRQFGVLLDEATLKAEAMRLGLLKPTKDKSKILSAQAAVLAAQKKYNDVVAESGKGSLDAIKAQANLGQAQSRLRKATDGTVGPLTQQQKILAAQSEIYKQSADAQGDFKKTSGGLANQQRILSAQFKDARSSIGKQLLPVAVKFTTFLNDKMIPGLIGIGKLLFQGDFTKGLGKAFGWAEDSKPVDFLFRLRDAFFKAKDVAKAFFDGLLNGEAGYASDGLDKVARAGIKVRDFLSAARDKAVAFGGWLKNNLWPALKDGYKTILPGIQQAFKILTGKDGVGGGKTSFSDIGDIITNVVIPAVAKFVQVWLPELALQIRIMIEAVKAGWAAFITFKNTVAGVAVSLLRNFADISSGFGDFLAALGNVPGFGWAKDAAAKLQSAADKARNLADAIDDLDGKEATIRLNMKAVQGRIKVGDELVNIGMRARGGPVRAGQPYVVGEKRPELFVPNRSGTIIPQVPTGAPSGEGGVTQNFNGPIMPRDYGDFERQMESKRRQAELVRL